MAPNNNFSFHPCVHYALVFTALQYQLYLTSLATRSLTYTYTSTLLYIYILRLVSYVSM